MNVRACMLELAVLCILKAQQNGLQARRNCLVQHTHQNYQSIKHPEDIALGDNTTGCREEGGGERRAEHVTDTAGEEEVKTKLNRKEEGK